MGYVQEARENHVKKKVEEGIINVDYITITETLMNYITITKTLINPIFGDKFNVNIFFLIFFSSLMLKKK